MVLALQSSREGYGVVLKQHLAAQKALRGLSSLYLLQSQVGVSLWTSHPPPSPFAAQGQSEGGSFYEAGNQTGSGAPKGACPPQEWGLLVPSP